MSDHKLSNQYDVIVIGGGASGMFCAGLCARSGGRVLLLEKNQKLGMKLNITGKGRCNLTNLCMNDVFFQSINHNPKFMMSSYSAFDCNDTWNFFENSGLPLKKERGNRVFPISDSAYDVTDTLKNFCRKNHVSVIYDTVTDVSQTDTSDYVVTTNNDSYSSRFVVIATGGLSYPKTGSTGDGYRFAEKFGHTIIPTEASLVGLVIREKICSALQGISLKNIKLTLIKDKKVLYENIGEMLFAHYGVSGPLILSASAHVTQKDIDSYHLLIDFKPGLTEEKLEQKILSMVQENPLKNVENAFRPLLPHQLLTEILTAANIPLSQKTSEFSKEERKSLVNTLKRFSLTITQKRPIDEAVVTSGGVNVREINPKTMESKKASGLYFCGEVMDVDAYTGGFNLQIAWSTAYSAALDIIQKIGDPK